MHWMPYEVMATVFQVLGYTPSPEQEAFHRALLEFSGSDERPQPTLVVVGGGLQSGKSFSVAHHILGRYAMDSITWLVGRNYDDASREYEYIRDIAVEHGLAERTQCSYSKDPPPGGWEMRFKTGGLVRVISSEDVTHLHAEAPDGIVLCEPGRQTHEAFLTAWDRVLPQQGWLALCGTFERAAGWYRSLWRDCQGANEYAGVSLSLPSYANRKYCPQGPDTPWFITERDRARAAGPGMWERFQERFLGIPMVPHDMVFHEFTRPLHVTHLADYQPGVPVELAIDPGYFPSPAVVLFLQVVQGQVRVFDELYVQKVLRRDLITMVQQHWAFGHVRDAILGPYDGTQHNMGAESPEEEWMARLGPLGVNVRVALRSEVKSVENRIARVHSFLQRNELLQAPGLVFHPRVSNAIGEFEGWIDDDGNERGYRYRVRHDGTVVDDKPLPQDDHAASAMGYFLIERFHLNDTVRHRPPPTIQTPHYLTAFSRRAAARPGGRR